MSMYHQITRLLPVRFANCRLHLPCIVKFAVKSLGVQDFGRWQKNRYRAQASRIGYVEFQTSGRFSLMELRKLVFVHPWIHDLRDPLDRFTWRSTLYGDKSKSDPSFESLPPSS